MPVPLTTELLPTLRHGQRVRYRVGRHTNETGPAWTLWRDGELYLARRTQPLPRRMHRQAHGFANVGDIIELTVCGSAECPTFTQGAWDRHGNVFNAEEYLLEIALPLEGERFASIPTVGPQLRPAVQHRFVRSGPPPAPPESEEQVRARLAQAARSFVRRAGMSTIRPSRTAPGKVEIVDGNGKVIGHQG